MSILERLGRLFARSKNETPQVDWSNNAYHSPEDWERHRRSELKKFRKHTEEITQRQKSVGRETESRPVSNSPYGGGGWLTEERNVGELSDRERGWTV